jgi:hypothetical protein
MIRNGTVNAHVCKIQYDNLRSGYAIVCIKHNMMKIALSREMRSDFVHISAWGVLRVPQCGDFVQRPFAIAFAPCIIEGISTQQYSGLDGNFTS